MSFSFVRRPRPKTWQAETKSFIASALYLAQSLYAITEFYTLKNNDEIS